MKFELFKEPQTKDICVQIVLTYEEVYLAYQLMHPLHRDLLNDYFKEESPACDYVFGISEIMKVLNDHGGGIEL